jgi:hypothetical protein
MENIEGGTTSCPDGWYGSMDRNFCFKVNLQAVNNEEACRYLLLPILPEDFLPFLNYRRHK